MNDPDSLFHNAFRAIFLVTFAISTVFRWRARRYGGGIPRRAERRSLILGRALIGIPLFATILLYLVRPSTLDWSRVEIPDVVRWIAVFLGFAGIPLIYWVFHSLGRNVSETTLTKSDQTLVTSGPYHWVRHPLYSASLAIFFLLGLVAANWLLAGLVAIAAFGIRFVVAEEEAKLRAEFPEYEQYMTRTGRFVPHWRSRAT